MKRKYLICAGLFINLLALLSFCSHWSHFGFNNVPTSEIEALCNIKDTILALVGCVLIIIGVSIKEPNE